MLKSLTFVALAISGISSLSAQVFNERFSDWPVTTSSEGTLLIARETDLATLSPMFTGADRQIAVLDSTDLTSDLTIEGEILRFDGAPPARQKWINTQLSEVDTFCWISDSAEDARRVREMRDELCAFLKQDKILFLIGPHSIAAGQRYASVTGSRTVWRMGAGLIPGSLLRSHPANVTQQGSHAYLKAFPRNFCITLHATGMLALKTRKFRVLGEGAATFDVPKGKWLPARSQTLNAQSSRQQDPNEYIADLTEWRRESIERTLDQFPPLRPDVPRVPAGTLVIVGGGGMPEGLMDRFVEAAGGQENARLVYVPCAEQKELPARQSVVEMWKRMGVQHAVAIHTKDRNRANTDEEFFRPLLKATGVWFGGGRQWNLADSYYGTRTHELMKDVMARGGVVGGSSAGASIQARYLARATPIQNFRIMAPGYERGGLGFISGVAIDQHFTQRGRQKDMTQLVNRYPQMLGIGLDEATAIVVQKSRAEVVGRGHVFFYNRRLPIVEGEPDYVALPSGSSYDLKARKVLHDAGVELEPDAKADDVPK